MNKSKLLLIKSVLCILRLITFQHNIKIVCDIFSKVIEIVSFNILCIIKVFRYFNLVDINHNISLVK